MSDKRSGKNRKRSAAPAADAPGPGDKVRAAADRNTLTDEVELSALDKDGEKLLKSIEEGNMGAIVSGLEIMYVFIYRNQYQCFIHPIDSEDGRFRAFDINARNRAMLKNLDAPADQLFEIRFGPDMDFLGVMEAAEMGIVRFMDYIGLLPVEDKDFMDWMDPVSEDKGE